YDKLLVATGGSPRRIRDADPSVIDFRRLADFKRAWEFAGRGAEFAVIGGGFIGSEFGGTRDERSESGLDISRRLHRRSHLPKAAGKFSECLFSEAWRRRSLQRTGRTHRQTDR